LRYSQRLLPNFLYRYRNDFLVPVKKGGASTIHKWHWIENIKVNNLRFFRYLQNFKNNFSATKVLEKRKFGNLIYFITDKAIKNK
jgi:hypothetical protein